MTDKYKPDDIVKARRKQGYGDVNSAVGPWPEGGIIPMRYEEAHEREDAEVAGKWEGDTTVAAPAEEATSAPAEEA